MQGTWALTLRSLRQDSRLLRFHLLRLAVASALVLAVLTVWDSAEYSEAPGRFLLEILGWANFWSVTIAGVLLFVPTITEEKEDQTLGLLRMTGIGPASLLLGKALPKLAQLLLVLIVQLPLVWLTLTLGGVDWPLMTNVYLLVFGQLIGVVAISMLASVMMRTSFGAVLLSGVGVVLWIIGPLAVVEQVEYAARNGSVVGQLLLPVAEAVDHFSLYHKFEGLLQSGATAGGSLLVVAVNLLLVAGLSLVALWTFDYWNQHEQTQSELEWMLERWQRLWSWMTHLRQARPRAVSRPVLNGPSASPEEQPSSITTSHPDPAETPPFGRSRPSTRSWNNSIVWKEFFLMGGGRTGFRVRCGLAGFGLIGIILLVTGILQALIIGDQSFQWRDDWSRWAGAAIMDCFAWAFSLELVYLTVNLFSYELRRQTWESLQLLPLSLGTICRRKILGAACHLIPWAVAFLCGLAMSINSESGGYSFFWEYQMRDPLATLANVLQIVTQFVTALIVLTWLSLRFNPWIAILLTGVFYCAIGVAWIFTLLMAFGFMSPPGPYYQQVLFCVGWIGGISLLGWGLLRSIRSTLRGESASV